MTAEERARGIVTMSAGNHAGAVAYAAGRRGHPGHGGHARGRLAGQGGGGHEATAPRSSCTARTWARRIERLQELLRGARRGVRAAVR